MAYCSNGSEGAAFQAQQCERCVHDMNSDCPVWALHLVYNGDEKMTENVLNALIPYHGGWNGRCKLFHRKTPGDTAPR